MMMKQLLAALVFFNVLVMQVRAWGATGHMIVSQIAWKHLNNDGIATPAALKALENAVTSLVSYSDDSDTFVTAAVWMDDLRGRALNQFVTWHYINLPICQMSNSTDINSCFGTSVYDTLTDRDDENALWAIKQAMTTIYSNSARGFERGFSLRNLLHLVGDIHQPLHAVQRYSDQTPYGDEGGNLFKITNASSSNLHSFWDSGVGMLNTVNRPLNSSDADYISQMADQMIAYTANMTANVTTFNVTQWAVDSRDLAIEYAYNLTYGSSPDAEYIAKAWDIVQRQIGLGGYRLYLVLKQIIPCHDNKDNCPVSEQAIVKKDNKWYIVGICLAAALGVSTILNIILYTKARKRSQYDPIINTHKH